MKFLHGFEGVGLARDGRVGQVLQLELENKGCIQEKYWNGELIIAIVKTLIKYIIVNLTESLDDNKFSNSSGKSSNKFISA